MWTIGEEGHEDIYCKTYQTYWSGTSRVTSEPKDLWEPTITAKNPKEAVYVVWGENSSLYGEQIFLRRRVSGFWTEEIQVTNTSARPSNLDIIADTNSEIHLVWQEEQNGTTRVFYNKIGDPSIEQLSSSSMNAYEPKIMVSPDSNQLHVLYVRDTSANFQLVYRNGTTGTWTSPQILYESELPLQLPALTSTKQGDLLLAWVEGEGTSAIMMGIDFFGEFGEPQILFNNPSPRETAIDLSRTGKGIILSEQGQPSQIIHAHKITDQWSSSKILINQSVTPSYPAVISNFYEDVWVFWLNKDAGEIWYKIGEVDSDSDGLSDLDEEREYNSDPLNPDTDGDGLLDGEEVHIFNTDPTLLDTDSDEMPDGYEIFYGLDPTDNTDASEDLDQDNLENYMEWYLGFEPNNPDTDEDGLLDGDEHYEYSTYPGDPDCDDDGLLDGEEILIYNTNPNQADSDGDKMPDGFEADAGLDPLDPTDASGDLDEDGLDNYREWYFGCDPTERDSDQDGLEDGEEYWTYGTHPGIADYDQDELNDYEEIILYKTNPNNNDTDGDGLLDGYEVRFKLDPNDATDATKDSDGDGLSNLEEFQHKTYPNSTDTDQDNLDDGVEIYQYFTDPTDNDSDDDLCFDGWEIKYGLDPTNSSDGSLDLDEDGLINSDEFLYHCSPLLIDSDNDTLLDGPEVHRFGTNPAKKDSDQDGLPDNEELILQTDPLNEDSDGDVIPDGYEVLHGLNPLNATDAQNDPDQDALDNLEEYQAATKPFNPDTDGDGLTDGQEVKDFGTIPTVADSDADQMDDGFEIKFGLNPLEDDASEDNDQDSLTNLVEYQIGTFPNSTDSDQDGMDDGFEYQYDLNPLDSSDAHADLDADNVTNLLEFHYHGNPRLNDTDGDGLLDNDEISHSTLLDNPDSDEDLMFDGFEVKYGLDPLNSSDAGDDPDQDGLSNLQEYQLHTNPISNDSDNDSLLDGEEVNVFGTSPIHADTDHDGFNDGLEIQKGTDPLDRYDNPKIRTRRRLIVIGTSSLFLVLIGIMGFYAYQQKQKQQALRREREERHQNHLRALRLAELAESESIRRQIEELFQKYQPKDYFKKSRLADSQQAIAESSDQSTEVQSKNSESPPYPEMSQEISSTSEESIIQPVTEENPKEFWNLDDQEFVQIPNEDDFYVEISFVADGPIDEIGEDLPTQESTELSQEDSPEKKARKEQEDENE
ncbi:MAG: hypothetical protein GF308_15350 [Candidatus Heimdallarchaeota archaeon]|nr:hypothetical protein [Candidatus Heimdallarchaeota archaeon]